MGEKKIREAEVLEDSEIIRLFFERSEDAIAELSAKYGGIFNNVAMNVLHDREDAEECVNDAYLAVWNKIPPEKPDMLCSFVSGIVRNKAIDRYRHNTKGRGQSNYDVCIDELEEIIPSGATADGETEKKIAAEYISRFVGSLNKTNRMIFVRRFWYMDSYEKIAKASGMNEGAVRTRASRIKADLKKYLEERGIML